MLLSRTMLDQNLLVGLVVLAVVGMVVYMNFPKLKQAMEGFVDVSPASRQSIKTLAANGSHHGKDKNKGANDRKNKHVTVPVPGPKKGKKDEGFSDFADYNSESETLGSVPMAAAQKPAGCYQREQLNPVELLPADPNSQWAQVNPGGAGEFQGKSFLSAGALIGVNSIGQSMRNSNLQLRSEPPCPQAQPGPWNISTIEPDLTRKPLE